MSSWIGGSISSLTGQLSNLTKDILSEGTEETTDLGTENRIAQEKIQEQDSVISVHKSEIARLKSINKELEEKAESSELQINSISREYRSVLETKEKEVNDLKKQNSELLEQHARAAALSTDDNLETSSPHQGHSGLGSDQFSSFGEYKLDADDWHFDDNLRLQQEANQLRSNLQRTQAEVKHWKSVAGQLGQNAENRSNNGPDSADVLDLQHKVKDLEAELSKKGELLQQQAASLHDHHRQKLSALKERHSKEIQQLQDNVSSLEQQLDNANKDNLSSGPSALPESDLENVTARQTELQEKLAAAIKEKTKAQNAREHLEGVLEELQGEVERLQLVEEQQRIDEEAKLQKKGEELHTLLEKSESENKELKQELQTAQSDLVRDKFHLLDQLDANHADVQSVLSDMREMREGFDMEAIHRRSGSRVEMRQLVNQLFHVSHKKNEASNALLSVKEKHDGVKDDMTEIIDGIGDSDVQRKTAELYDTLQKENITLKEQKLKLEEQVVLLEKMAATSSVEELMVCDTSSAVSTALSSSKDGGTADDNTKSLDSNLSHPESSHLSPSALHISKEEVDEELIKLKKLHEEMLSESSNFEMERADWLMEKEALEDVLTDLRNQSQKQEEKIQHLESLHSSSTPTGSATSVHKGEEAKDEEKKTIAALEDEIKTLREENGELERALEDLDSQHSEALNQLIGQRNKMAGEILERDAQIKQYRSDIESLNAIISGLKEDDSSNKCEEELEEKIAAQEKELSALREKNKSSEESLKEEISELNQKLQKGGLVINDLHMDKQELGEELKKTKEDLHITKVEMRKVNLEKTQLNQDKEEMEAKLRNLEEQLAEMEEEVDKWQQVNEEKQIGVAASESQEKEECLQLRSQIQDMEKERKTIEEEFQHLIHDNKPHSDLSVTFADSPFKGIFEEEMKVRDKLEQDENIIQELKGHVEKLQSRKNELKEQVLSLEHDLTESNSLIESIKSEKADLEETLSKQSSNLQSQSDVISELENKLDDLKTKSEENTASDDLLSESEGLATLCKNEEVKSLLMDLDAYKQELLKIQRLAKEHEQLCEEKDGEIENLKVKLDATSTESSSELLHVNPDSESQIVSLLDELQRLKEEKEEMESVALMIPQLELELVASKTEIKELQNEVSKAQTVIACNEAGICDLNEKSNQLSQNLAKAEVECTRQESTIAVLRQNSIEKEQYVGDMHTKLNFLLSILNQEQVEKLKSFPNGNCANNAIEYEEKKAIGYTDIEKRDYMTVQLTGSPPTAEEGVIFEVIEDKEERISEMENQLEELQKRLSEKDLIVSDLQKSNSSLLGLVERGGGGGAPDHQVSSYKLEAELQSLRMEREQMVGVVSEKSRENSSLKLEIQRLMEIVSASQAALAKLQEDNAHLEHEKKKVTSPPRVEEEEDDMRREALANMARLVRDRETEIEALRQKNETLLAVLQETKESEAAAHLGPLLKEKETLSEQMKVLTTEREQLIACIQQKHAECLAYHGEAQRLAGLLAEAQGATEKVTSEYNALIPAFEDKSQALVANKAELAECKKKLTELEIRYGELIQRSNTQTSSSPTTSSPEELETERERHRHIENDLKSTIAQRDSKVESLTQQVSTLEDVISGKEAECMHVRKQLDNSKFQLSSLMSEIADVKVEKEQIQQRHSSQDEESSGLRDNINRLTLALKDKELQLESLREQIASLNSLVRDRDGEQSQVAQLIREKEAAMAHTRKLQQENELSAMRAQQRLDESQMLRIQMAEVKEKEQRLSREVERLRSHLIEMEEGYTTEALESEEREKELRNRLAIVEEQLSSSSSQVHLASQESSRQIDSLQDQLRHIANQRDSAYIQITSLQDQCQQYSSSLSNLQLVLEHFQKEKDSAIAVETEKYQNQAKTSQTTVAKLQSELEATRADLVEALDGLDAASRISEQLDRKEQALNALKEEVQLREQALNTAEEEIRNLKSNTEAKVDKMLMHNIVMTWLTSPEKKRPEIIQLIGHVLDFSSDDFSKIESAQNQGGLLIGFFKRTVSQAPSFKPDQSFSQLFVKFLEKESSPPPTPVKLPAEAMAAETQHKHKSTFNPFMAPRHAMHDGSGLRPASQGSSHLLMSQDGPAPSPLFAPVSNSSRAGESAILKDVLNNQR